jgi:hypothetical protein
MTRQESVRSPGFRGSRADPSYMINGMAESKLQKRAYRKALREHQGDRLSDLVAASHFGSDVCLACTLVRPASAISDGVCSVCRQGLSRFLVRRLVATSEPLVPTQPDPLAIYVDASWQDGVAGLAIVGALGSHLGARWHESAVPAALAGLRPSSLAFRPAHLYDHRYGRQDDTRRAA